MADENAVIPAAPADPAGVDKKGGEGGGAPEAKQSSSDDTYEPEVRKPWSNREERAEFFKAKKKESGQEGEPDEDDPDFVKKADAYFEKRISPQFKQLSDSAQEQKDDFELRSYLAENPTMKKYEARAKKDMKAYPTMPVNKIFRSLAYDDALAEGATRGDKAKVKAKAMSEYSGVRLGRVVTFSESGAFPTPIFYREAALGIGGDFSKAEPIIEPGSQELRLNVAVTYEIR